MIMRYCCTLFILFFFFQNLIGQNCCPFLNSLELQPIMPTTTDSIYLNVNLATPNQGHFIGYEIEETDTLTTINACYYSGFLTAIQTYDQTFNLGVRGEGVFMVRFVGWISSNDTTCNFVQSQSMDLEINIEGSNSIFELGDLPDTKIFPNPAHINEVTISSEKEFDAILVFDGIGKLKTIHLQNPSKAAQLGVNDLPQGVYFVKGMLERDVVFFEKLIRN